MARHREAIHIGIGGHVVAIDIKTGGELWRTKLKSHQFTSLMVRDKCVYAASGGELFCLDADTGAFVWHNKLKGLGMSFVTFAGNDGGTVAGSAGAKAQAAATHSAG